MAKQGMLHSRGELLLMLDADGATKVSDLEKLESQVGMTFDYSDLLYLQNVVFIIMIPSFGAQIFIQASNENLDFINQYTSFISSNYSNSFSENPTSQCSKAVSFQSFVSSLFYPTYPLYLFLLYMMYKKLIQQNSLLLHSVHIIIT